MNRFILFLCLGGFAWFNVGCTSNDDIINAQEEIDSEHYAEVYSKLFERDLSGQPILADGMCLDSTAPKIFSVCEDSLHEGEDFFYSKCIPSGEEYNVHASPEGLTYSFGKYGSISFISSLTDAECSARILFNLTVLPHIEELRFIPRNLWPYNNWRSPFNVGSILVENNQDETIWYCLRKFESGHQGILITFDHGWNVVDSIGEVDAVSNCASQIAWYCFCFMKSDDEAYFERLCTEVTRMCDDGWCSEDAIVPFNLIRGFKTSNYEYVQIGDWNKVKNKIAVTGLNNAVNGLTMKYKFMSPSENVFTHSYSRTFNSTDEINYEKIFPER